MGTSGSVQCAGVSLGQHRHICAFFNSVEEQHRVLRSFIKEGFEQGDKAFHIVDPEWGHLTIMMSGHRPFGLQISLNGHEWVKCQAQKQAISWVKEGNCFVGGSDLAGLNRLAEQLDGARGLARLAQVVDRWVYSACLCFALNREQQKRSVFRYAYSCYQLGTAEISCSKAGANWSKSIKD